MSELSFEQMFEESSFKRLRTGEAVTGQVIGVKEDEIILSIAGSKSEGIITRSEFTNEPGVDPGKDGSDAEPVRMAVAYETGRIYDRNHGGV